MTDRPGRPPYRWRAGIVVLTRRWVEGLHPEPPRPGRVVAVIQHEHEDGEK